MSTSIFPLAVRGWSRFLASAMLVASFGQAIGAGIAPTELREMTRSVDFFPDTSLDPAIPTPEALLGFPLAQRAASSAEIERCLRAWTNAAPQSTKLIEYARSHEGRPLHLFIVTSPTNHARLDQIQAGLARLGDPRQTTDAEAEQLIQSLPAVAWLAYTIHGDETEGSDAALAVLYYLIAAQGAEADRLRNDLVVVVDPLMNPDGRDRFVKMIAEHRGAMPNVDDQSLLHDGYWPYGRGNHYLFDLNRDWLWAVHPETRGRMREVQRWNPVLFVDAHGMGSQDTHLFSPPREPINPNIPRGREAWAELFAREQAAAFDRRGLVYYTGEWHEEWYPGYSDAWASYRGAVGILYEQARVAEDGVRRPEGRILAYRESVLHHVVGSLANLRTTQANARQLLGYLRQNRKVACDPEGPYGRRTFAVLPTLNRSRLRDFIELARLQGFEVFEAGAPFTAAQATNQLGQALTNVALPAGTILIPNRQPQGHLLAAALEFDPRMSPRAIEEERQEILRTGGSRIYDFTTWNLTMFYGLPSLMLGSDLPPDARPWAPAATGAAGLEGGTATNAVALVLDGADDLSVAAAARLLERGVQVRAAEKDFRFDGHNFVRGSVVVVALDNATFNGDLRATVDQTARELGLVAYPIQGGLGAGDLPDLGGRYFQRLEPPRIALLSRGQRNITDFGSLWHTLDHRLGVRHSAVEDSANLDLGRYNVLIVPEGPAATGVPLEALKDWVRDGGTLIAIGNSANRFMEESAAFSKVRPLSEVLTRLADYELAILREWLGRATPAVEATNLWAYAPPARLSYPWQSVDGAHPDEKELKRRDAWQRLFLPAGALLATRVDTNSWLTFGCREPMPALAMRQTILMAADGVEAPIRYGYLEGLTNRSAVAEKQTTEAADGKSAGTKPAGEKGETEKKKEEPLRLGWSALPPGAEMRLRMSGLLWPEATHQLANSACVTRERFGRGQVILFATPPTLRGATRGPMRVLLNAVVYGPGFGASQSIRP